jgi:hypothetical protein
VGVEYFEEGIWTIRTNQEVRFVCKVTHLVADVKRCRLEWLGHVIRMDQTREAQIVFDSKPKGKMKVRRFKLRWLDDAENDLQEMKLK